MEQKQSKYLSTRHYEGYGYLLRIANDGVEDIVTIEPYDPVFGVGITYINGEFFLKPPRVNVKSSEILMQNIKNAKDFCAEFDQRKNELLKAQP